MLFNKKISQNAILTYPVKRSQSCCSLGFAMKQANQSFQCSGWCSQKMPVENSLAFAEKEVLSQVAGPRFVVGLADLWPSTDLAMQLVQKLKADYSLQRHFKQRSYLISYFLLRFTRRYELVAGGSHYCVHSAQTKSEAPDSPPKSTDIYLWFPLSSRQTQLCPATILSPI